jgi:hypothetical protein
VGRHTTGYRVEDPEFDAKQGYGIFLSTENIQTSSEAHPATCAMGTWVPYSKSKVARV